MKNIPPFLRKSLPFIGSKGAKLLKKPLIAFAGLGGVGGFCFLSLVRAGISRFRIADNGIFNIEDLNRQYAAFHSTLGKNKTDVYLKIAKDINPKIEIETFPRGISVSNIGEFLNGAAIHVAVSDSDTTVWDATSKYVKIYDIPMFGCSAIGFGSLMTNFHPKIMMPDDFWIKYTKKLKPSEDIPSYIYKYFPKQIRKGVVKGLKQGITPSTSIGPASAGIMLASEIITYLLRGTGIMKRKTIFVPKYVILDFTTLQIKILNINK